MAICKKCGAEVVEGAIFCTECGEQLNQPFEVNTKPSSNPFAEMEANVPKPEVSSVLIFDDPVADYKAEQAAAAAAEAAADASQEAKDWSGQTNYGKPQFDPNAKAEQAASAAGAAQAGFGANAAGAAQAGFGANAAGAAQDNVPPQPNNDWERPTGQTQAGFGGAQTQQNQYVRPGGAAYNTQPYQQSDARGNDKLWGILCYFTVFCWLISYFASGANKSSFLKTHLNQSIILHAISVIAGWLLSSYAQFILGIVVLVLAIMGIVYAGKGEDRELPGIGQIRVIK